MTTTTDAIMDSPTNRVAAAAVARLFEVADSDTGQARRVSNFLLAWHNGAEWGHFDISDLFSLDRDIGLDIATVVAFLAGYPGAIYPHEFVGREPIARLIEWRPE